MNKCKTASTGSKCYKCDFEKETMYKMYVGLSDQYTHRQRISTRRALCYLMKICSRYFADYTVYRSINGYTRNNKRYCENGFIVEIFSSKLKCVERVAAILAKVFNQSRIYISKYDIIWESIRNI